MAVTRWVCPQCGKVETMFVPVGVVSHGCPKRGGRPVRFVKQEDKK